MERASKAAQSASRSSAGDGVRALQGRAVGQQVERRAAGDGGQRVAVVRPRVLDLGGARRGTRAPPSRPRGRRGRRPGDRRRRPSRAPSRSGVTPITACAPPGDQRKPVTTSSKTTSASAARAAAAMRATWAGASGTAPHAAPVGSRITQATSPRASSASSAPSANGSTTVRSGFGGDPLGGSRSTGSATPGLASSCQPWKCPASLSTRLRAVKPRATRSASSVASVPLEVKRTRSALGTSATMRSAQSASSTLLAPKCVPEPRLRAQRLDDGRMRVARDAARRGPSRSRARDGRRDPTCRRPRRA